jgi:hypothetical protein
MSLEDLESGLENWEPQQAKAPNLDGWKKHAFRPDKRAEERRAKCLPGRILRFECPSCGILRTVEPVFVGDEWHYYGQCSYCGANWAAARNLMRKCEKCGKRVPLTSRNPEGQCKCEGEVKRKF